MRPVPDKRVSLLKQWMTWVCALSSVALVVGAVLLALHVRLGLGHWPTPMREDYRTLAYQLHEQVVVGMAAFAVYAAVPLWILFVCLPWFRISGRVHVVQVFIYLFGWALVAILLYFDPYRFVSWLAD
jgi:hypothetical protein